MQALQAARSPHMEPHEAPAEPSRVVRIAVSPAAPEDEGLRLRASGIIFIALFALTVGWLYPSDLGPRDLTSLALLLLTLVSGCIVIFQIAQLLVDEPASEVVGAIFGHRLSVRSRSRFLRRLEHECTDTQLRTRNRGFSLVVMRLPDNVFTLYEQLPLPNVIDVVRARIRSRDILGDLGSGELWVLALGAGGSAAEALAQRLSGAISRDVPPLKDIVRLGWSTFDVDARDVKQLLAIARNRAGYDAVEDLSAAA
jgi:hypothetical protein